MYFFHRTDIIREANETLVKKYFQYVSKVSFQMHQLTIKAMKLVTSTITYIKSKRQNLFCFIWIYDLIYSMEHGLVRRRECLLKD